MLKGMTEEMIALGAPADLENVVLQIWACYLKVHKVAFTSRHKAVESKLSFPFRYRDGKVRLFFSGCIFSYKNCRCCMILMLAAQMMRKKRKES